MTSEDKLILTNICLNSPMHVMDFSCLPERAHTKMDLLGSISFGWWGERCLLMLPLSIIWLDGFQYVKPSKFGHHKHQNNKSVSNLYIIYKWY